jgi:hypothetical protein
MYEGAGSKYSSDAFNSQSNMSQMYAMYTTTFGNGNFAIQSPSPGEVGQGYPMLPYVSIEAIFYQQQQSNPATAQVNVTSGTTAGQQILSSTSVTQDSTGTARMLSGNQQTQ